MRIFWNIYKLLPDVKTGAPAKLHLDDELSRHIQMSFKQVTVDYTDNNTDAIANTIEFGVKECEESDFTDDRESKEYFNAWKS